MGARRAPAPAPPARSPKRLAPQVDRGRVGPVAPGRSCARPGSRPSRSPPQEGVVSRGEASNLRGGQVTRFALDWSANGGHRVYATRAEAEAHKVRIKLGRGENAIISE